MALPLSCKYLFLSVTLFQFVPPVASIQRHPCFVFLRWDHMTYCIKSTVLVLRSSILFMKEPRKGELVLRQTDITCRLRVRGFSVCTRFWHTSATNTNCMFLEVMTHCYISAAFRNQKFITQNTVLMCSVCFFSLPGMN